MEWFAHALRDHVELALFLALAAGNAVGLLRVGTFQIGPILGTLIAGVIVGEIGIRVPGAMQAAFFLLFLFAVGFSAGPEFLRSLRGNAAPQLALTVLLCVTALALASLFARLFHLDGGATAGLLAGAMTNSPALGTASTAAANVGLDPASRTTLAHNVATAYALTYVPGAMLVVWFLPTIGPRLLGVSLREAAREAERASGATAPGSVPTSRARSRRGRISCRRCSPGARWRTSRACGGATSASSSPACVEGRRSSTRLPIWASWQGTAWASPGGRRRWCRMPTPCGMRSRIPIC